jgi:hypothetical protein
MLHLLLGGALGVWLVAAHGGIVARRGSLLPAHAVVALLGWLVQFTLGVGYWILPRFATGLSRGPAWAPWLTLAAVNGGVGLVAGGMTTVGLTTVALGVAAFLFTAAPRIKAFGTGR